MPLSRLFSQVGAIWWAQFRTTRNHLPRRSWASVVGAIVSLVWYAIAFAAGFGLLWYLPQLPFAELAREVPMIVFGIFLFWQITPLFTLSSGWSLQLNKLLMYPIPNATLFGIEAFLRFTTAPEMLPVLGGLAIGLLRHPEVPRAWPLLLVFFVPFNLFLALSMREVILHSFERNRFREVFAILLFSLGLIPQIIVRSHVGAQIHPYFQAFSEARATPWAESAHLALGMAAWWEFAALLGWCALSFFVARWLFARSLLSEDSLRAPIAAIKRPASADQRGWTDWLTGPLPDPLGALLQKELQSVIRMPRFRVVFGLACLFGIVAFFPLNQQMVMHGRNTFITSNFPSAVALYGLLILSDLLLLNAFGVDRSAAELYYAAPIPFRSVIYAKNLLAVFCIALQSTVVLVVTALFGLGLTPQSAINAVGGVAVVTVFFLAVGNICSVTAPRPSNPAQTFRRQAGGKVQLWLLLCAFGMFVLVGAASLASWAVGSAWAGYGVLTVEFGVALIFYFVAVDSATNRAERQREQLLSQLSRNASPIGLGS